MKKYLCSFGLFCLASPIFSGNTIDFIGDRLREAGKFAQETVEKGTHAVGEDISRSAESVRQGVEGAAGAIRQGAEYVGQKASEGVQAVAEGARQGAAAVSEGVRQGAATVGEAGRAVGEKIGKVAASTGEAVTEGARKAGEAAQSAIDLGKKGAEKISEFVRPVTEKVSDTAKKGAEFAGKIVGAGSALAEEATQNLHRAVKNTVETGAKTVKSGIEITGKTAGRGVRFVGKTAGQGLQTVGEALRNIGIIIEEGAQQSPEELARILEASQRFIDAAMQEGSWRMKEAAKLATGAAGIFVKNKLPIKVSVTSPDKTHQLIVKGNGDEQFVGTQMRVTFVEGKESFVVSDPKTGELLATLHTGFNGDLLWVSVESPMLPDSIRAYLGGHNGEATYDLGNGIKVRASWWINPAKFFLHDIQFELLQS